MADDFPIRVCLVVEARADADIAKVLADRVMVETIAWIDEEGQEHYRAFQGLTNSANYLCWQDVKRKAKEINLSPVHGPFNGKPGDPDAVATRRTLLLIQKQVDPLPRAVFLIRDTDGKIARRNGIAQAQTERTWPFRVIVGLAHMKRECWVLAGFEPANESEEKALKKIHQELGFDPCTQSDRLTATHDNDKRSAKRVLVKLSGDNRGREEKCYQETSLATLRQYGNDNGLTAYLEELESKYVPLFKGR